MDQDPARPSLLYHYTSAAGLNGILTSGSIYATDVEFHNEAQELWYGRPELCDALTNELHASPGTVIGDLDGPAGRIGRIAVALQYLTGDSAERRARSSTSDSTPDVEGLGDTVETPRLRLVMRAGAFQSPCPIRASQIGG